MADIPLQFPNFANALAAGSHARYSGAQARLAAAEEQRRLDAQPFVGAAMQGDPGAMAKVASGDPKTAVAISTALSRMDANQRAQTKEQGEYAARAANAILQADPKDRATIYADLYAEGQRRGYKMTLPPTYSPQLDSVLRSHRAAGQSIDDWFKQNEGAPTPIGPGASAAPTSSGTGGAASASPPADLLPHFQAAAAATGLPQPLLHAQASVESGFNPTAVSPAGAGGVMQLMPGTARDLGVANVNDAGSNIRAGAAYLKQQLDKYGNLDTALAAYNWGPGNVDAWLKSGADPSRMPAETRNYITQVKARLGGGQQQAAPGVPGPVAAPPAAATQVAQGDAGRGDGSGTPVPPSDPRAAVRGVQLPPGARLMGVKGVPVVKDGTVMVQMPDGSIDFVPLPQRKEPGNTPPAGPFGGTSMDAQYGNILAAGASDPAIRSTFAYAQAYAHASAPRTTVDEQGRPVTITPNVSHLAPPTFAMPGAAPQVAAPGGAPQGSPQSYAAPGGQTVTVGPQVAPKGPSAAELAKYRDAQSEGRTIIGALEDFRKEYKAAGIGERARSMFGAATPANTAYSNAALLAKGEALFNLGVLNGPDLDIIRRTLPDPSTWRSVISSEADMNTAVDKVIDLINSRIAEKGRALGIDGGQSGSAGGIPQGAIDRLKANPGERAQFDEIFGPGAAAKVLGK